MASAIDATIPADNVKASKSAARTNNLVAKNEITALQLKVAYARLNAFSNTSFKEI